MSQDGAQQAIDVIDQAIANGYEVIIDVCKIDGVSVVRVQVRNEHGDRVPILGKNVIDAILRVGRVGPMRQQIIWN